MKAKIFRFSGYLVDTNNPPFENTKLYSKGDICELLKSISYTCMHRHIHVDESPEFIIENNDHPILKENCDLAHLERHFIGVSADADLISQVVVGGVYRHFKEGKMVKVLAVSRHSERPQEVTVVYECQNGVYNRPIEMFLSDVDKEKYPNAIQEKRFELVTPKEVIPIEDLEFSVRAFLVLKRAGIMTLDDICDHTEEQIKNIRNMGRHTFEEITSKLRERGLKLKEVEE